MKRKASKSPGQPKPAPQKPKRTKSEHTRNSHPWIQMKPPVPRRAADDDDEG